MDRNTVYYGLDRTHFAPLSDDSDSTNLIWEAPIFVDGSVSYQPQATAQGSDFYASNRKYHSVYTNNGESGDAEFAILPEKVLTDIYNYYKDANGGLLAITDKEPKKFAFMFETGGDKNKIRVVYYMCTGSPPTLGYGTTTETIDIKTTTVTIDAAPVRLPNGMVAAKYVLSEPNETSSQNAIDAWENFFTEVTLPAEATIPTP